MRCLSADERSALAVMANPSGPDFVWRVGDLDEARWDAAHESLVSRGCASHRIEEDDESEWDLYDITDLGRLALRVSFAAETVS